MHRRQILQFLTGLVCASTNPNRPTNAQTVTNLTKNTENRPPNIVIILTDDQGFGDVGAFGAKGYKTPNLDQMARDGRKFTNFHVAQPVCGASRAALLTGCYPNRIGIHGAPGPGSKVRYRRCGNHACPTAQTKRLRDGYGGQMAFGRQKAFSADPSRFRRVFRPALLARYVAPASRISAKLPAASAHRGRRNN